MNELQIFNNSEFGEIRTVEIDGKPYFGASDVATALGYINPRDAISRHCKGVVKSDIPTNSGIQSINFIPEGDVYRLIVKSQLPSAEKFEKWVFDEVLPQIRQTGGYQMPSSPLEALQMMVNQMVEQEKRMDSFNNRLDQIEAKSITSPVDYYTVAGFASVRKQRLDISRANMIGRKAAQLSREYGYDIGKVSDPRYGTVNTYHVDILNKVMK